MGFEAGPLTPEVAYGNKPVTGTVGTVTLLSRKAHPWPQWP